MVTQEQLGLILIKDFVIQACLALLVGAGVFYIAAPHSWGLGAFYQELTYAGIAICISLMILVPVLLLLFRKKRKYFFSMPVFCFIGIALTIYLYPAPNRYLNPSDSLKNDIEQSLHEAGMPLSLRYTVHSRRKVAFDIFVEHKWEVTVWGRQSGKYQIFTYVEHFGEGYLKANGEADWLELTRKPKS